MATNELKGYLETRLRVLDPGIDLEPGSPAQVEFIEPLLKYLGTDPFETDIDKFLTDRLRQEFPDIYGGDPGAVRDLFIKPLILFLEPFKRETQSIKRGQSLIDPSQLSDEDADAIVANVFDERKRGGTASGSVRVYFQNPSNVPIETTVRFGNPGGLGFFPTASRTITAEEMVFNRSGSLYYVDVPTQAEKAGSEYNIDVDQISTVDGLFGVARVTNLRKFENGGDQISTPAFIAQSRESLNERSLLNRRGANARLRDVFPGELLGIQVIGAGDLEMERDILVGESSGHSWVTGRVVLYGSLAFIQARVVEGATESPPVAGDTLYAYFKNIEQSKRLVLLKIEEVLSQTIPGTPTSPEPNTFQCGWLVRWSGSLPAGVTLPASVDGGCRRKGIIKISSIPGLGAVSASVGNGDVHVLGHTDIYVRPTTQDAVKASISSIVNETPLVERTHLLTTGDTNVVIDVTATDPNTNLPTAGFDFLQAGVRPGDALTIESGDNAGSYVIGKVVGSSGSGGSYVPSKLYLTTNTLKTGSELRYRVSRELQINPFDPKIKKLPFADQDATDLSTQIGSNLFAFEVNTIDYGVRAGDVIRVKSGKAMDQLFTITGFDSTLGGHGVLVDRASGGSEANISYEISTPLEAVKRPLVRLKELLLLDSSRKSTGISVPPAEPVGVVPTSNFTTAQIRGQSFLRSGFVLPAMSQIIEYNNSAAASVDGNDRRYSAGFDGVDGGYFKAMGFLNGAQSELLFPGESLDTCSYFMATVEDGSSSESFPPGDVKPGDAIQIKTGPNAGGYVVEKVRKWKYKDGSPLKTYWLYFIKIHGVFPVDVFGDLIQFFRDNGISVAKISSTLNSFPGIFTNFYSQMGSNLSSILTSLGALSSNPTELQSAAEALVSCDYEWGVPARGVLRTYLQQPTLFQQNSGDSENPTTFEYEMDTGEIVRFRPDPELYPSHEILPARGLGDTDVLDYPRDAEFSGTTVTLSIEDKPSAFALGISEGDVVEIRPEIPLYPDNTAAIYAAQTVANSPRIQLPQVPSGVIPFKEQDVGNLLSIEEGDDTGMYRITGFVDSRTLVLDRVLSSSTPAILATGVATSWGFAAENRVYDPGIDFTNYVNKWLTLYGVSADSEGEYWQGSYRIKTLLSTNMVEIDTKGTQLPAFVTGAQCVVTDAPSSDPTSDSSTQGPLPTPDGSKGTKLYGLRPIRMYQDLPHVQEISGVTASPTESTLAVPSTLPTGRKQPYRIYRKNIRRVNPLEMSENRDGSLVFFDTEVVSLTPRTSANLSKNSYLTMKDGTYSSEGYRHVVADRTLTYSTKEEGSLVLPLKILSPFASDRSDNSLNLAGSSLQISYELASVVGRLQTFLESVEDRVTAANLLARHFLPSYVSYEAAYSGGSAEDQMAKDIIGYINSLTVETTIDVSLIQDLIRKRGGNVDTPTKVTMLLHDWGRRMWVEFSENELGGRATKVPYDGTPRVSYFIPGPDLSGKDDLAYGERMKLTRR
jgi:hypothetical protein